MSDPAVVKQRPILFSGPMVCAILAGTKKQTRRIVKPSNCVFGSAPRSYWEHADFAQAWVDGEPQDGQYLHVPCHVAPECELCEEMSWQGSSHRLWPLARPGEWFWVRETWQTYCELDEISPANLPPSTFVQYPATWDWVSKKRSSIHMPRWASRISLEITDVRVQRLQDISEEDAIAEGVESDGIGHYADYSNQADDYYWLDAQSSYKTLWNSIHGAGAWDVDPFVWCYSFRRVTA